MSNFWGLLEGVRSLENEKPQGKCVEAIFDSLLKRPVNSFPDVPIR